MLDLEAGVHLEEEEFAGAVVEQELDRAGVAVAAAQRGGGRRVAEPRPQVRVDRDRGRLLEELLVAALHRALALAEGARVAVRVGHHLHLDVAGRRDVALEEDGGVAERRRRLGAGELHRAVEVVDGLDDADPAPAAAAGGLHHEREADALGLGVCGREVGCVDVVGAGDDRHAGIGHQPPRRDLVAHRLHRGRGRANERDAVGVARLGEGGVLGQEAVAGVHRVGARVLRGLDDAVDDEVGLGRRAGTDADGGVGLADVERVAVGLGEDGDGLDAEFAARALHAQRDLATVRQQHALGHRRASTTQLVGLARASLSRRARGGKMRGATRARVPGPATSRRAHR